MILKDLYEDGDSMVRLTGLFVKIASDAGLSSPSEERSGEWVFTSDNLGEDDLNKLYASVKTKLTDKLKSANFEWNGSEQWDKGSGVFAGTKFKAEINTYGKKLTVKLKV